MRSRLAARLVLAAVSVGVAGTLAPPVAAKSPAAGTPLVVTAFVQDKRTDVRRNEPLVLKFSALLSKKSVDDKSLRIYEAVTGAAATGARIVRGNVVRFDPTMTQAKYDATQKPNAVDVERDHAFGFTSVADFVVEVPATPEAHVLTNGIGRPILLAYRSTFRTNATYDDFVPGQPYFVGDHGNGRLGFVPPPDSTGLVDPNASIVLEFNEPMALETIDPSTTLTVVRTANNETVPGYVTEDPKEPNGRRFLFVPSVGFGSNKPLQQGWDVAVTVSTGALDVSGVALKRPAAPPTFRTKYSASAPSCSLVTESFDDQKNMDPSTVALGGEWDTLQKGVLKGGFPTTFNPVDVRYTAASTGNASLQRKRFIEPLVSIAASTSSASCGPNPTGARLQLLYVPADFGAAGAVTAIGWGPSSNALFSGFYPQLDVSLGHSSKTGLTTAFDAGVDIGSATVVYSGPYTVPQMKNVKPTDPVDANGVTADAFATGTFDYPAFLSPFEWNGVNQVIVDLRCSGGSDCQILRAAFLGGAFAPRRAFAADRAATSAALAPDAVVYDLRVRKRRRLTYGVSNWRQVAAVRPSYAAPIVSPIAQPGGVTVSVELEGADGKPDPFHPGGLIADPSTGTGFTSRPSDIQGKQFFRFRVTMSANLATDQTATITAVQVPYCF